ncbi:uncharacterized protein EAE97_011316 [Botrytis byssoidea]|uniref:C2H2-type domain-containing protein n=1 Tax=Botrytis byssoidea TaxID=139641 RepID=A0A9P5LTC5_9HELO|nr:uncharacterized protein EAE97_011316 [Botrytis byssoidea]KAF7921048.1 hypothetical protein EAE97_011316 [Botrytis byssoidea]
MADGTADEQAALEELHNDVFSEVPPSNDDEMPDTPNSPSTQNPPNKDYNYVDTEQVKRYTCPYCTKSYINTRESMSHIAPIDMEQAEVLKCPHCEVPSIREKLEFTEEIIEARLKKSYIPISTGAKRYLCPYCKRDFNTTFETMWTIVPELTEQGELLTCLYCQKSSLRTTLESHSDTMFREFPHIAIPADETSSSNSNIHISHQTSSPDQDLTGTPSSQFLEGIVHMPASQNSPKQEPAFQTILDRQLAIQNTTNQYPALELPPNQQLAFQPDSNEQLLSNSNSYQQPTYQSELYQQPAFQITLDQRSGIQDITNQYPAFQTAFDQQPTSQPSLNRQSISQLSFNQQSTFLPTHRQKPVFQFNPSQQPMACPTLDQQPLAVRPNFNQQSTSDPNTDQQLASNPSSQTDPLESLKCQICGMGFFNSHRSLQSHKGQGCKFHVRYFCPERNCDFNREKRLDWFTEKSKWRRHLINQHNFSFIAGVFYTYNGEVRDLREPTGWRAC